MAGTATPSVNPWHGGVPVAGPGPRPGHADLRVSNQDREQVVEHVKAAYAEGRFDKLEFDDRLERAMTARVHGDLIPIMQELYGSRPPMPMPYPFTQGGAVPGPARCGAKAAGAGDRGGAAAAHLLPLTGLVLFGPLIMLLAAGRTSPYIRRHAVEALNFQLTLIGATILLAITVVGAVLLPVLWIGGMVLSVVGGLAALGEGEFRYPFTLRLVK
ncbi:DUF1707 and DUF4870 domain-containing protein [Planomonospora venezuelensis]|uniref:Putative Tic20 family protein n=1 Tax=Planomonospora venezuelensis TaxID=1999 RepID=A0A841DDJ4_PLAVE|nr:DUF1707 and DUF4870 domain-containing protein [Planomonospora venezuelensis]MBB5966853.1 putative Tic20 family protein [Planomonospora venezuelensis]GIN03853.1 hypothetical protein Pve01_55110 [Planomonospora venezuelensis]